MRTDLLDGRPVVLAEIGNGLVVGREPPQKPDDFQIAAGFTLQSPARLDAIEIPVDVKLQERRWVVGRSARRFRDNAVEVELAQIERIDERVNHANRIALVDEIIKAFGQQCRLPAIHPRYEALHHSPPQIARRIIAATAFLRSQGHERPSRPSAANVSSSPDS